MMKLDVLRLDGVAFKKIEVSDEILKVEYNHDLVYRAIVGELTNRRQGTVSTKTRGEVRGGGKKPWKQKGTGRARQGSIRSPIWVGGGIAQGPRPREFEFVLPKKMKRKAYFSLLSEKLRNGDLIVVEDFSLPNIKTKEFINTFFVFLGKIESGYGVIVLSENNKNVVLSSRNLPNLLTFTYNNLNLHDLFYSSKIFFTESAIKKYEEMYLPLVGVQ
jgi:large subunit ribosomal protein L4